MAQRGGGGHAGGGGMSMGGGSRATMGGSMGGGYRGGAGGGGYRGGTGGTYMGGGGTYMGGGGYRGGGGFVHNGFGNPFGLHPANGLRGVRGFGGFYYPYNFGLGFGYGLGYWPGYYGGYGYGGYPYPYYGYGSGYYGDGGYGDGGGYAGYQQPGNVTVVYPPQQAGPVYTLPEQPAHPVTHEYDQYGQEVRHDGTAPPIYLLAFKDKNIRAATAYWVDGKTLHYVTYEREQRQAPLDTLDRDLTTRLNGDRHVELQLPPQ